MRVDASEARGACTGASGAQAANGQSTHDEYSSASRNADSSGANGSAQSNGIAKQQPKIKVPKIKQPKKPTPAQAAEALHVSRVKKVRLYKWSLNCTTTAFLVLQLSMEHQFLELRNN